MIQPEDILAKARRLYPAFLNAWLEGNGSFFPRAIPADKQLGGLSLAEASAQVQRLRAASRESLGYGYDIEWEDRKSREFGQNTFPRRIVFQHEADFLRYIDRQHEFAVFANAVERLRRGYPVLLNWIRSRKQMLIEAAGNLDGLLLVLRYFEEHPLPDCFVRELPIAVDTKFIERHERLLREWFDIVLPPHAIRSAETQFAHRYGLRSAEPHWLLRLLDPVWMYELQCPCTEFSLPLAALANLPVKDAHVIIVENKVNLLTLPQLPRALALGGMGYAITQLREVPWLSQAAILYWGDIDVEGFAILSSLRALFPQTLSRFMDSPTLDRWQAFVAPGSGNSCNLPPHLTPEESLAWLHCHQRNIRLEQERIPQSIVVENLALHRLQERRH